MTSPSGLWAEGDNLSPTNLNRRNPVGTFPAKTYHVAWAAGTGTTQITNAIANAAAGGYTAVFVDASRIPYNGSAVTFNTAVHMLREGGSMSLDEYDALAFGVTADGSDQNVQLQKILDRFTTGGTLRLPRRTATAQGIYGTSKPLWMKFSGTRIIGDDRGNHTGLSSQIKALHAGGPALYISGPSATVSTLVTALATGTGSAWQPANAFDTISLREISTLELNGLTQFCVEFFYNPSSADLAGNRYLVSSRANFPGLTALNNVAFQTNTSTTPGQFVGAITTTNGTATLDAGALTAGTTYHIALTWDGTTVRLFVAGSQVASTGLTGTLKQTAMESVDIGPFSSFFDTRPSFPTFSGIIDSVRISNTARYTAAFTAPTAKLASDANTLALLNFDDHVGDLIKVTTNAGTAWAWYIGNISAWSTLGGTEIDGISITNATQRTAGGIYVGAGALNGRMRRLEFSGLRDGVRFHNNGDSFFWHLSQLRFDENTLSLPGGRNALLLGQASGAGLDIDTLVIQGYRFPIVSLAGGFHLDGTFIEHHNSTVIGTVCAPLPTSANIPAFTAVEWSLELGSASLVHNIALQAGSLGGIHLKDCSIEMGAGVAPIYAAPSINQVTVDSCYFNYTVGAKPPSLVATGGAPAQPILFINPVQSVNALVPLADVDGRAAIIVPGMNVMSFTSMPVFDASKYEKFNFSTFTGDVTASFLSYFTPGQRLSWLIQQDSTGSRLWTWPSNMSGAPSILTAANGVTLVEALASGNTVYVSSVRTIA